MSAAPAWAVAALLLNAFVWGVSWWPFRALDARGLHALWATVGIYLVSVVCLLAVRPGAWRGFGAHGLLWLLAAASGLTNATFNWAVTVSDVVRVVLLFYLMPIWSMLLAWPLLGERPTAAGLAQLALALAGVAVVLGAGPGEQGTVWPWPQGLADWLSVAGGASFALTNVLLRRLADVPAPSRALAMFAGGAVAALGAALIGQAAGLVSPPGPALVATTLAIALALSLAFLAGNLALQYGAARLPAAVTALIMLAEVVFASVSSVLAGAAELSARTWIGGAAILGAALWAAWPAPRARPEAQSHP